MATVTTSICFVVCNFGPAAHFSEFIPALTSEGREVKVFASERVYEKMADCGFDVERFSETESEAERVATLTSMAQVIITDLGKTFSTTLHRKLQSLCADDTKRIAYWDNPESFVPGGYSEESAQTIALANYVVTATHLSSPPCFAKDTPIDLSEKEVSSLGYFPIEQGERIAKQRATDHATKREEFLTSKGLSLSTQLCVLIGGNNTDYFDLAIPALRDQLLTLKMAGIDLNQWVFLIQQHPAARAEGSDIQQLTELAPHIIISDMLTDDALVIADCLLYRQTSMAPQFVAAGIPTIQFGPSPYQDLLAINHLCLTANTPEQLQAALKGESRLTVDRATLQETFGFDSEWRERLKGVTP